MKHFFERLPENVPSEFQLFSVAHIITIIISLLVIYIFFRYIEKIKDTKYELLTRYGLAILMLYTSFYIIVYAYINGYPWYKYLPEATCGYAAFLGAYAIITKNRFAFLLTFFYGWGAFTSIFAPNIQEGITRYYFYQFYIRHIFIVLIPLYMIKVDGFKLRVKDNLVYIVVTLPASLIGLLISYLVNNPDELNMFYMLQPAVNNTLLDDIYNLGHFVYLVVWILIAIIFGFIYGLPFYNKNTAK